MNTSPVERDGIRYYPHGDGEGQLRTDHGEYGTTWRRPLDGDHFTGITAHTGGYTAIPGSSARLWKSFKTLRGAVNYLATFGMDAHGAHTEHSHHTDASRPRLHVVK